MSDPKKAADEPTTTELSSDELDAVTGGAVDSFIYFQNYDGTPIKGEVADTAKPTDGSAAIPGGWNRVKN